MIDGMRFTWVWIAILLGLAFACLAVLYWITPAGSLPAYLPGFAAGSPTIHFKHGLASLIIAIGLFVLAWFASGKKSAN